MQDYAQLLRELKERTSAFPESASWTSLYVDLFSAQAQADVRGCVITASPDTLIARLQVGQSLLAPGDFQADRAAFLRLCHETCSIVAKHHRELTFSMDAIRARIDEDRAEDMDWAFLPSDNPAPRGDESEDPLPAFVYNQALHPFLRRYAEMLLPFVDEAIWYRPSCPICGGKPDLAALTRTSGARQLLCSRCDAEWFFLRTGCPFCEGDNLAEQQYSVSEDHVYRLCLCEHCKHYLKTIDLREVEDERLLPVERILTAPMDIAALKAGYSAILM